MIKTVHVTVHVWRHADGDLAVPPNLSFSDTPAGRQELKDLVEQYTLPFFAQLEAPSTLIPGFSYPDTDIKIRFEVVDVRFIYDTYLYENSANPAFGNALTAAALLEDPDSEGTLHVHVGRCGGPNPFAGPPPCPITQNTFDGDVYAAVSMCNGSIYLSPFALAQYADEMVHELGHALGLRHIYSDNGGLFTSSTMETCTYSNQAEFLYDVYGTSPADYPSWLSTPPSPPCDVGYALTYYNNLMAVGTPAANDMSLTPLQIGRMHRNLMTSSIAKYGWGYDPVPYSIAQTETWDFPLKFYQDIEIPAGVTLTIQDELHLVPEARIVVKPGGKLVIDGGVVRHALFAPAPWQGIEVWGNSAQSQAEGSNGYLLHQGLVEIKNGGSVEGAVIGVYLGKPGDPTKAGGVLRMENTSSGPFNTIRDCQRMVKLDPYIHHQPITFGNYTGTMAVSNRSRFAYAHFEVTDAFPAIFGEDNPIDLIDASGVAGLRFRACAYVNSRTDAIASLQLGNGIRAHNSSITVTSACPDPNQSCPLAQHLPSTFTGLDLAIYATSSAKRGQTVVERSIFTDNVCGVYVNGQAYPRIIGNTFTYGGRVAVLDNPDEINWQGRHRGIFLHRCNGIRVWDNFLSEVAAPLAETEGIVVGYTTTGSETIRKNNCTNIDRAYVGEGISASPSAPAAIGLQFLCNLNSADDWNIWSRIAAGSDVFEHPNHTIRTNQGDQVWAADNYLDNCIGSTWDLRIETVTPVTYWCRVDPHYQPQCIDGNALVNVQPYAPYQDCQLILVPPSNGMALQVEVEAATTAYAALRFLYANLIDGGSTDAVLEEIADAWPQDYWELRDHLLSLSPYLSVEALKVAMDKPGFPDAMRAEICIANPEATQLEGFIQWLVTECIAPLPEYLVDNIRASWDTRTYRFTLEAQMGHEHARMSEAAYMLMDLVTSDDEEGADVTEEQATMAHLRSPEMRYHEAALCMGMGRFAEAQALIEALPDEHDLRGPEVIERSRMLTLIDMLEAVHLNGRTEAQLTAAEIAQFEAFIAVEHDRPTNWASNLLCYNYGICRSSYTGEAGAEPKALVRRPTKQPLKPMPKLELKPNPANAWVAVSYDLQGATGTAQLVIRNAMGSTVHEENIAQTAGQALIDTRALPAGAYVIEVQRYGVPVVSERLILQP